jgi:hypothetical protein
MSIALKRNRTRRDFYHLCQHDETALHIALTVYLEQTRIRVEAP